MGWSPFFETHEIDEFIEAVSCFSLPHSQASKPLLLGIYLDPEELPIGYVVLKGFNQELHCAEVGLAVLEKQDRAKGFGRLGLKRIVDYGFEKLNLKVIRAAVLASNAGSINMCKKTGFFVKETMHNAWTMPDGALVDMLWMELHNSKK
jgi:RimJ/RimL family protein N-acetyltransferase